MHIQEEWIGVGVHGLWYEVSFPGTTFIITCFGVSSSFALFVPTSCCQSGKTAVPGGVGLVEPTGTSTPLSPPTLI
ncbi:uncharacterized [Tachysurus ichikawai]